MKRRKFSSKSWLALFALTVILLFSLYAAFNFVVDPFGAFGDRFLRWYSYDFTQNPRVAKLAYLKENSEKYDSYIIGSSATSSFPVDDLNEYMDASFFNMIMYGSDMLDVEQTARWLAENCEVKNLVLCVQTHDAMQYGLDSGKLTDIMHCEADGSSPRDFYLKYLFCDWRYAVAKLKYLVQDREDGYLQDSYDCFDPETGAYDKSKRDVEGISDLAEYISRPDYSIFANYPHYSYNNACIDQCMQSIAAIKELCDERKINMLVVCPPMYSEYLKYYYASDLKEFGRRLAEITDFWDFTMSSASYEPRYFYDETHFRNALGSMALAKMFQNDSVYAPEDLGYHVTKSNAEELLTAEFSTLAAPEESYTAKVPILVYHETYEKQGEYGITAALFEEHMAALCENGYTAVTFDDLRNFVEKGTDLPEKPVVITFDDGYLCNVELAAPILEKYGMNATIFAIGVSCGKDVYKDTGRKMNPHFGADDVSEWIRKGVISVQSHGYNVHEVEGLDEDPIRHGALQKEGEPQAEYISFLRDDTASERKILLSMGQQLGVMAYPHGAMTQLSEVIYAEEGVWASVGTEQRMNTLIKGLPQSLRNLGRFSMERWVSAEAMLKMIEGQ